MMASRPERRRRTSSISLSRLGILSACAVAVYVFESYMPMPIPWARLGLSNVVVVTALFGYGFKDALIVNLARIVAGNLLLGLILSPAFIFSIAGSMAALFVMAGARWKLVPPLSVVGTSALGAVTSNVVQVTIFTATFALSSATRNLMGAFILLGVGVGFLTGLIAARVLDKVGLARPSGVN